MIRGEAADYFSNLEPRSNMKVVHNGPLRNGNRLLQSLRPFFQRDEFVLREIENLDGVSWVDFPD